MGRDGWTLGLFDRNVERLAHVEEELSSAGLTVLAYPGDVTNADELTVAVNSFAATHDGLDVMVNNAGVAGSGTLMEVPLEDWRWIVDINFMGVVHGARAAIPHLQRNGSGLLINVASAAAFAAAPGMISYNATKAAVLSLSETLKRRARLDRHAGLGRDADLFPDQPARIVSRPAIRARAGDAADARVRLRGGGSRARRADCKRLPAGFYIVLPGSARMLWRLKRWAPLLLSQARAGAAGKDEGCPGESTASMKRV